jgi:hypothetical protein
VAATTSGRATKKESLSMTIAIFAAAAVAAGLLVTLLTWKKAGVGRTLLAAAIGMAVGAGVILAAQSLVLHEDTPFSPSELLGPFAGAFIAATASNRRHHALQQQQQKS